MTENELIAAITSTGGAFGEVASGYQQIMVNYVRLLFGIASTVPGDVTVDNTDSLNPALVVTHNPEIIVRIVFSQVIVP